MFIIMRLIVRLFVASHPTGKFDVALVGFLSSENHSSEILGELARILKPKGKLYLKESLSLIQGK